MKNSLLDNQSFFQLRGRYEGHQVIIVNAPMGDYLRKLREKNNFFEGLGVEETDPFRKYMNALGNISVQTWGDYFDEAAMIVCSFIKEGTISDDGDQEETGKPFFDSVRSYINNIGAEHSDYYAAVDDLREKCAPGIMELNTKQEIALHEDLIKKNEIWPRLAGLNYTTLKNFTITSIKQYAILQKENLQNLSSLRGAETRILELEKGGTKKKTGKK